MSKRVLGFAVAAIAFGAAYWAGNQFVRQIFGPSGDVRSRAALEQLATKVNQRLPIMLDSETEFASVTGLEGVLVYNYRLVNKSAADLDAERLRTTLGPTLKSKACEGPDTRDDFLNKGVTLRYAYADKDRVPLLSIDVAPSDCGPGR